MVGILTDFVKIISRERVQSMLIKHLDVAQVSKKNSNFYFLDLSGGCLNPVRILFVGLETKKYFVPSSSYWEHGLKISMSDYEKLFNDFNIKSFSIKNSPFYGYKKDVHFYSTEKNTLSVVLLVPCRRCVVCAKRRAFTWQNKISQEYFMATRTWLVTLTLNPVEHFKVQLQIPDYLTLSEDKQFLARYAVIAKEITKYFKRIRKNEKTSFRYFLALEKHKSGLPHFHVVFHEIAGKKPLTKRGIQTAWKQGFTNCKLVNSVSGVTYVSKYLVKSNLARVRASIRYGDGASCP